MAAPSLPPAHRLASRPWLSGLLGDMRGGLVASTVCLAFSISNGALIYSAVPQPMLVRGIVAGLVTSMVASCVLAMTSAFRPVIGSANAITAGPLAAIVVAAAPGLAGLPPSAAIATAYALVGVTTVATGLFLILLGTARLGKLVRYIPFPVVAGFMGELGAILVLGAVRFSTGVRVTLADLPRFAQPRTLAYLAATVAFAAMLSFMTRRFKHPLVLPGMLLGAIVATVAAVYAIGDTIDSAALQGLFLAPRSLVLSGVPLLTALPAQVHWQMILPFSGAIAAYALLVTMATLLTSTGLEAALNVDADYDRELRAQGVTNFASALVGGFTGNPSVGSTMAGVTTGARGRVAGFANGAVMLAFLLFGLRLLPYIPRFVLGGFIMHIGLWILVTWCVQTRGKMPRGEWYLVLGIVAVTVTFGLVQAIFAGIIGGCVVFALDVSRLEVVRRSYGLDSRASPLVRSREALATLSRHGRSIQFVELSGMLFFGSAHAILARVRALVAAEAPVAIVLDLTSVTGCDSSTTAAFTRLRKILAAQDIGLAVAGGSASMIELLRSTGGLRPADAAYPTRDQALEATESSLLEKIAGEALAPATLVEWLSQALGDHELAAALAPVLRIERHPQGSYLCRMGDPTDTLLFIESGRVDVMVGQPGAEICVRIFGPRSIVGEHGFALQAPRTASLKVEADVTLWVLERRAYDCLTAQNPTLAIVMLKGIIGLQSERLAFATRQTAMLA